MQDTTEPPSLRYPVGRQWVTLYRGRRWTGRNIRALILAGMPRPKAVGLGRVIANS